MTTYMKEYARELLTNFLIILNFQKTNNTMSPHWLYQNEGLMHAYTHLLNLYTKPKSIHCI